ncbi:MAG: DNA polymerase III subunit alpha [bacterium]|nr:DNA polymerase III subunit alpha [bacterium]
MHLHSPFSFLDGASRLEELVAGAARYGQPALALTDHDNVSGAVLFHRLATAAGLKPIQGAEISLEGGYHLTLLARNPRGYANLCALLTRAHLGSERRRPALKLETVPGELFTDIYALSGCRRGEVPHLLLRRQYAAAQTAARRYARLFGRASFFLELSAEPLPGTRALNRTLADLAGRLGLGVVATGNVHYRDRSGFPLHDLLTCVRTLTRLDQVHPERRLNAGNYLRSTAEMAAALAEHPRALATAAFLAENCRPALDLEARRHPRFSLPPGKVDSEAYLRELVYAGARRRYGRLPAAAATRLEHELGVINALGFADYFLLVEDVVRYARERGIRCAGRGSAADSAVTYCLGITEVDAFSRGLLFERFMSRERAEKPDIDLDLDARRRDEVAAYVYEKYGRERVAAVCTYHTYHARSALRDFGKAMGFPPEEIDRLARRFPWTGADEIDRAVRELPELRDSGLPLERFRELFRACAGVAGFPRHQGTHLGGLVIGDRPLTEVTPLQLAAKGVVVCQFDRDYVEDLGLVKLDLLFLRTLGAVDEAARSIARRSPDFDYERIPLDDRATFRMINRGQTMGVFQLESPAQRALQSRLGARHLEDIVASLALIRPGPIKGNMVEPFIARRRGEEPVSYPHPRLEPILQKTYGVVLFQEQVIEIATAVAGFSPGEADRLRRVMTHARSAEEMESIGELFLARAAGAGVDGETARAIFSCLAGYASYGFCEAHAAAFSVTAYKTAYLVRHYPAEFYAAVLSLQPMGYYPPATICREAIGRGVPILPLDINASGPDFTVEEMGGKRGIRVSLARVKGMGPEPLAAILAAREEAPFRSLDDFRRRVRIDRDLLENLVLAGAFDRIHANRRRLVWELGRPCGAGMFREEAAPGVDDYREEEKYLLELGILSFSPGGHLMDFLRAGLRRAGYLTTAEARRLPAGRAVRVAGLPVRPHRPPTRSGRTVVFLTLEDECGLLDVTIFERAYQRYGALLFGGESGPLGFEGRVERRGRGVSLTAWEVRSLAGQVKSLPPGEDQT